MPSSLRKNKGFSPWSVKAHEPKQVDNQMCLLDFMAAVRHVHRISSTQHFTSLDVRIAGRMVRALLDSGATCSCLSQVLVQSCGLQASNQIETLSV